MDRSLYVGAHRLLVLSSGNTEAKKWGPGASTEGEYLFHQLQFEPIFKPEDYYL